MSEIKTAKDTTIIVRKDGAREEIRRDSIQRKK